MRSFPLTRSDIVVLCISACLAIVGIFALSAPDLVAFSTLLVIPFLILFPAPTAFFYTMLFALAYFTVGRWNRLVGAGCGLLLLPVVAIGVPRWINERVAAEDRTALGSDRALPQPLTPHGVIGIVKSGGEHDRAHMANNCDKLCLTVLYTGNAGGVIMASSMDAGGAQGTALLWKIARRDRPCVLVAPDSSDDTLWRELPNVWDKMRELALIGECAVSSPARLADADLVIEHEVLGKGINGYRENLTLYPELSGTRMSLWRFARAPRAGLLARQTWLVPRRLADFLHFTIAGSPNSGAYWEWAGITEEGVSMPRLGNFLTFNADAIEGVTPEDLRGVLDAWLDHPEWDDPELLSRLYMAVLPLMSGDTLKPGDLDRYKRLIRDSRTSHGIEDRAREAFPGEVSQLRDVIFERIATLSPVSDDNFAYDNELGDFPAGTFAQPTPLMLSLLRDRERRSRLPHLITRLADGGPDAAPVLFALLDGYFTDSSIPDAARYGAGPHGGTALAAIEGLCRLGPAIPPAYQRIEKAVDRDRNRYEIDDTRWAVIRVRLGHPIEMIEPPANAPPGWLENVRKDVAEARCSRN